MRLSPPAVLLALLLLTPTACTTPPSTAEFEVGMSRPELIDRFGEPDRRQSLVKRDEAIWGAIEDFWPQVPSGSSVLIWGYAVEDGTMELYFVDDSPTVDGMGFAPEGAVFEAAESES